jgi:O-antigen ligase
VTTDASRDAGSSQRTIRAVFLSGFLVLNVVLGGAIFDAPAFDLVLQMAACVILGWCVVDRSFGKVSRSAVWLLGFLAIVFLVCLLQLLPLPAAFWASLPGRAEPAEVLAIVGVSEAALPLSLAPQATLEAMFWMLPPTAMLVLVVRLDIRTAVMAARWTVPALAAAGAILGIAQIVAADTISFYLHDGPAKGHAAGFFQVVNYQPTLMLMAVPFVAVLSARFAARFEIGDSYLAQAVLLGTLMLLLAAGLAAAGSMAGYVLVIPVALASLPIALHRGISLPVFAGLLVFIVGLALAAFYTAGSPLLTGVGSTDFGSGPLSRIDSWNRATSMAQDYFPVGAGVGSFRDAFGSYEDALLVTDMHVVHAHNDYLEVLVETGLPGLLLIVGLIGWWAVMTVMIWRRPPEDGLRTRKAASIAVAVVLLHSLVDSPARTEAIACLAALCLGLMASVPPPRSKREGAIFAHRHIEL